MSRQRYGLSIPEVLVVLGVLSLLVALLLPAVQQVRESARTLQCRDRLRGLMLATQSHESMQRAFPRTDTHWFETVGSRVVEHLPVSVHRHLMPHLDPVVAAQIDPLDRTIPLDHLPATAWSERNQQLLTLRLPFLLCPSDVGRAGATNYRCNLGPSLNLTSNEGGPFADETAERGAFVNGQSLRTDQFPDGLSQTIFYSERLLGDDDAAHYHPARDLSAINRDGIVTTEQAIENCRLWAIPNPAKHSSWLGHSWLLGGRLHTWYFSSLPPNSPIPDCSTCLDGCTDGGPALITARSLHTGAVNVALGDGAVRPVADSVSTTIWQALSTRNGEELIDQAGRNEIPDFRTD